MSNKILINHILDKTDIKINGGNPWDPQVHDERFYDRVVRQGTLGLGEAYMDGWWDCAQIDELFNKVLRSNIKDQMNMSWPLISAAVKAVVINTAGLSRSGIVGEQHYDLGNDMYKAMLGSTMAYSCGYWGNGAKNLDEAETAKLDLICRKLYLKPGTRVLDIGCGWGSWLKYGAEHYGVTGVGTTISKEQAAFANEWLKGLSAEVRVEDYRLHQGTYDALVSVGMFEHVGWKNYREFFVDAKRNLKPGGLFMLHTIGSLKSSRSPDPWIEKYIFPNSHLPSLAQITKAAEGLFNIHDVQNFGIDYDTTLMAWYANFEKAWPEFQKDYNDRFHRMWRYYLLMCAGTFRAEYNQLWQIVLSNGPVEGGYRSLR